MPQVLNFPITVAPGDSLAFPIRFHPTSDGSEVGDDHRFDQRSGGADQKVSVSRHRAARLRLRAAGLRGGRRRGRADVRFRADGRLHRQRQRPISWRRSAKRRRSAFRRRASTCSIPGRQEGQFDGALLYRRGMLQFGGAAQLQERQSRSDASAGALSQATLTFDVLLPAIRFGLFGSKGLRETDVVDAVETVGAPGPGGQPIVATEQVIHTIDQLGGSVQFPIVPNWWIDGNVVYLHRHAPGVGDTGGGAMRLSGLLFSNVAFTAAVRRQRELRRPELRWAPSPSASRSGGGRDPRLLESGEPARHAAATGPLRAVRARALRRAGGRPGFDREPARHPRRHCA